MRSVESAIEFAGRHPESIVLLGAKPRHPETAYGYIEPGAPVKWKLNHPAFWVSRFWEKPALADARRLVERGCLWNTFVMVGGLTAFLGILQASAPHLLRILSPLRHSDGVDREIAYAATPPTTLGAERFFAAYPGPVRPGSRRAGFRRQRLERSPGEPERVMALRARLGVPGPVALRSAVAREPGGSNYVSAGARAPSALLADREDPEDR